MKRLLSAALVFAGCARAPLRPSPPSDSVRQWCTTPCGTIGLFVRDCEGLARAEERALKAFAAHVPGWTEPRACEALKGFAVEVWPETEFVQYVNAPPQFRWTWSGQPVLGLTNCGERRIWIGFEGWLASAYTHELAHAVACKLTPEMTQHQGWTKRGVCAAVNEASFLKDDCSEYP